MATERNDILNRFSTTHPVGYHQHPLLYDKSLLMDVSTFGDKNITTLDVDLPRRRWLGERNSLLIRFTTIRQFYTPD